MKRGLSFGLALVVLLPPSIAGAAEPQPGDACPAADQVTHVGGPENPGTGYDLVCDGAHWQAVRAWASSSGRSLFQVNTDAGSCTSVKLGRLRYDGVSTWEYCNGTSWTSLLAGGSPAWSSLTNPAANLALSMAAYTTVLTYGATTGASDLFKLTDTASNTGTGYLLNVATATGSTEKPFHVGAAGTDALTVLASGNVGIGTTTPNSKLEIAGDLSLETNNLKFGTSGSEDTFLTRDAANTLALRNGANAQTFNLYNTYTDASNYERLSLRGTGTFFLVGGQAAGTGTARDLVFTDSAGIHALTVRAAFASTSGGVVVGGGDINGGSFRPRFRVANTAGTESNFVGASGQGSEIYVGGGAHPTATSTLVYQPVFINPTVNYSAGTPGAGHYEALAIEAVETALPTGANYLIRASAGAAGTTDKFWVDNGGKGYFAGNVGIGTTAPAVPMHVLSTTQTINSGTSILRVESSAATSPSATLELRTSNAQWDFWTGANQLNIGNGDNTGNGAALSAHYAGAGDIRVAVNTGAGGGTLSTFGVNGNAVIGNGYTSTAAPTNGMLVQGNVGIGTTTPANPLEVQGRVKLYGIAEPYELGLGRTDSSGVSSFIGVDSNGDLVINNNSGQESMRVTQGKNVGIGTTSPQATLDVNGYARLAKNSSQPTGCSSTNDGAIALTHVYTLCICKGGSTSWVQSKDGTTACSW